MAFTAKISRLEKAIGYKFKNRLLAERALTHRSWAHERVYGGQEEIVSAQQIHNEAIEFVGDSVLGLAAAEMLFQKFPKATEGELTLMKHRLVSEPTLANIAEKIVLGDFMRVGRGEEHTFGRRKRTIIADTLEALIAAVFLDSDYLTARDLVKRLFAAELQNVTPENSLDDKTLFQERLQAEKHPAPIYTVILTEGPPHQRTFHVELRWYSGTVRGFGATIKTAEMMAARLALEKMAAEKMTANSTVAETEKT